MNYPSIRIEGAILSPDILARLEDDNDFRRARLPEFRGHCYLLTIEFRANGNHLVLVLHLTLYLTLATSARSVSHTLRYTAVAFP